MTGRPAAPALARSRLGAAAFVVASRDPSDVSAPALEAGS